MYSLDGRHQILEPGATPPEAVQLKSSPSLPPQSERTKYPGMRPREGQILRRWLVDHESEYGWFEYNVRVGPGRDPGPAFSDAVRKSAVMSSQYRLDLVAWAAGRPTLIEVKDFAQDDAIRQLALYAAIWRQSNPSLTDPLLLIVCSNYAPGLYEAATAAGMALQVIRQQ